MRSSKSRSRNKSNRNRPSGNIVNRVFDSSGPEGKVRGTPQQIIDKYNQLARDAQLSNDRVAFENFQQHAEHYTRLLSEAQREMDARREQQERERERQQQQQQANNQGRRESGDDRGEQPSVPADTQADTGAPDVIDTSPDGSGTLVETPENPQPKARRPRRKRNQDDAPAEATGAPEASPDVSQGENQEAAE